MLASDPDADRIGVGLPVTGDPAGEWTTLDGNQIGVLLAAFVMKETKALGRLRPDHYLVTTLVSTQMARALAEREGVRIEDDLLVGFKWIGQRIDEVGPGRLPLRLRGVARLPEGDHVRDKDAAVASLLFAELAATVKDRKQTVLEYLDDLYIDVGHYGERLINKTLEGREGVAQIKKLMAAFRDEPADRRSAGSTLTEVYDYKTHEIRALDRHGRDPPPARALGRPAHLPHRGRRAPGSPPGRRGPSRRSSSTCSPGPPWTAPTSSPRPRPRPSDRLDRMAADIEQYIQRSS